MTKRKSPNIKSRSAASAPVVRTDKQRGEAPSTDAISRHIPSAAAIRETIESVVIAFVLAFLFRTFEAEAFVIPTGSMAPTLMGRHKDLFCPKCGCNYQVSASEEADSEGNLKGPEYQTAAGTCPMCRYTASVEKDPSYSGDRILVGKFIYEVSDPQRWDVIVFKFPGDATTDARTNFIKRLVGLPGETIRIQHGDLWVRRGRAPFQIARKPPEKLLAMLQPVFDNDYMPQIAKCGWPARWQSEPAADGSTAGQWTSDDEATFHADGTGAGESWLRYRHLVPSYQQWRAVRDGGEFSPQNLAPQLITDFTAYNTARPRGADNPMPDPDSLGLYWVGDLALRCTADVESPKGELVFELRKGGRQFQCRIDVATGRATLSISGQDMEQFRPTATTCVRGPGRHEIRFSNCDNELPLMGRRQRGAIRCADRLRRPGQHAAGAQRPLAGGRGFPGREGPLEPPGHFPRHLLHRRLVVRRAPALCRRRFTIVSRQLRRQQRAPKRGRTRRRLPFEGGPVLRFGR